MRRIVCWLACAVVGAVPAFGQEIGSVGIGYAWQHMSGNRGAFASQYDLSQGAFLEHLQLDLRHYFAGFDRFDFTADGFGGDPHRHLALTMVDWDREWSFTLDYARNEGVLPSPSLDLTGLTGLPSPSGDLANGGRFSITRWRGSLTWDGWKAARLRLDLRDVQRNGDRLFAYYGLGQPYVALTSLDSRVQEAGFSLETRTLPVKLLFEQDITKYTDKPRGGVGNGGQSLYSPNPNPLATYTTGGEESNTVPTTRLSAVYNDGTFELVGQGLYRRDRVQGHSSGTEAYAIDGGQVGQISYLDALTSDANADTKLGDLRLGLAVTQCLTLRVKGHYEKVTTDSTLLGQELLQLRGPGGSLEFPAVLSDNGYLDRTDKDVAGEAELRAGAFGLVVGYHDGSEEIGLRLTDGVTPDNVTRDAKGWNATASLALGRTFTVRVGWDSASFARYVFRTDPQNVKRVWGKISARPAAGIELNAHASHETLDNPATEANLSRPIDTVGVAASWTAASGAFASASVDSLKLTSKTAIAYFAPGLTNGLSYYDADLLTTTLRAAVPVGRQFRLSGGGLYLKDRGHSLPFTSKAYDLEFEVPGPFSTKLAVFGNDWSYDIPSASAQDYDVTRYGISVRRRF